MTYVNPILSVVVLNIYGLNTPMKRQRLAEGIKNIQVYAVYNRHTLDSKIQVENNRMETYTMQTATKRELE